MAGLFFAPKKGEDALWALSDGPGRGIKSEEGEVRVLVTGGHSRLGGAISEELARGGHALMIHYRSNEAAARERARALSEAFGVECAVESADLTDKAQSEALMTRAIAWGCDALVASASLLERDVASAVDWEAWGRSHRIHYEGVVQMSLALRRAAERCSIVAVSDQTAMGPTEEYFSYCMSKRAMIAALPSLALCVAPGRANLVAPGWPTLPTAGAPEADFERVHAETILRRGASAEDVARAVRYLLEAPAATGQILAVDGGLGLARPEPQGVSFAQGPARGSQKA